MPTNSCQHTWRAVNGEFIKVARWVVLEQCTNCGEYRERLIEPDSNHPNATEQEVSQR